MKKNNGRKRMYSVTIPYYHVFEVEAYNRKDAIKVAHELGDGEIVSYDDKAAEVVEGPYVSI